MSTSSGYPVAARDRGGYMVFVEDEVVGKRPTIEEAVSLADEWARRIPPDASAYVYLGGIRQYRAAGFSENERRGQWGDR